jgi:hypothetical protein
VEAALSWPEAKLDGQSATRSSRLHADYRFHIPVTSTSFPGSILPELGRTQYLIIRQQCLGARQAAEDILLRCGCFDLERNWGMVGISDSQDLGDLGGEGTYYTIRNQLAHEHRTWLRAAFCASGSTDSGLLKETERTHE